jgi:hypothetical protein
MLEKRRRKICLPLCTVIHWKDLHSSCHDHAFSGLSLPQDILITAHEMEKLDVGVEFWRALASSLKVSRTESIRLLLVEAIVLRVQLSACADEGVGSIHAVCMENGIGFEILEAPAQGGLSRRGKGGYALLSSPESGSQSDQERPRKVAKDRKKRKKSKDKKRRKRRSEPALKRRRLEPLTRGAMSEGEESEEEMHIEGLSGCPILHTSEGIRLGSQQFVLARGEWTATCSMLTIVPTLLEYILGVWLPSVP